MCVSVVRCWGLHVEMFCVLLMGWTVCAVRSSDCVWVMIAFFCCFFFSQKWVSVSLPFSPQPYLLYLECIVLLLFLCVDLLLLIHCNSFLFLWYNILWSDFGGFHTLTVYFNVIGINKKSFCMAFMPRSSLVQQTCVP